MKKSALTAALSIGIMSIGLAFATPQQAVAQLKQNSTQVLNILQNAKNNNDVQVRRQAENYAIPYFDFTRMTELAVGANWRNATPAQKTALTEQFKTLLIRTYSGTMLKFKNSAIDVKGNPLVNKGGKEIVVRAEISSQSGGKPVTMDYTMYQSGGKYRVYNVAVEGASLVTVYRSQFNNTIAQKGIDGLIQELRSKNGS